jgi:hypothetical protein
MHLTLLDLLGFVAGTLTTAAFVPQVLKSWQTRNHAGTGRRRADPEVETPVTAADLVPGVRNFAAPAASRRV